jgi:carbon starvation protein
MVNMHVRLQVLVVVVVANAAVVWVRAVRAGSLPTTEVPAQPSQLVAAADFVATKEEKQAIAAWEASRHESAGAGR